MARRKVEALPNIDLGGVVQVIDDSTTPPRWKKLARVIATTENAKRVARRYGVSGVWLKDDLGYRMYITL